MAQSQTIIHCKCLISIFTSFRSVHQRSNEKKQLRNKAYKLIKKEKREEMYDARKKERLVINEKVRSLERDNAILKRERK